VIGAHGPFAHKRSISGSRQQRRTAGKALPKIVVIPAPYEGGDGDFPVGAGATSATRRRWMGSP
jgi:hypothetical protein